MASTYSFAWPSAAGTVPVTQLGFTLKFTSEDAELKFTEGSRQFPLFSSRALRKPLKWCVATGLATYNTFDMHWKPCASEPKWAEVMLDNYRCLDAKTGEEMAVDVVRPTKSFFVDEFVVHKSLLTICVTLSLISRATSFLSFHRPAKIVSGR